MSQTHNTNVTIEQKAYLDMIDRCYNPRNKSFKHYGGRGITVCKRWQDSYWNFLTDMGRRPSAIHTLGRIDNDGSYKPSNCEWQTYTQQNRNTRNTKGTIEQAREIRRLYHQDGMAQAELAIKFNMKPKNVSRIIKNEIWKETT